MKKYFILLMISQFVLVNIKTLAQTQLSNLSNLNQYFSNTCPSFYTGGFKTCYANVWGFKDDDGREYAIMGTHNGTIFINVTDPANPFEVGFIPGPPSTNRDAETYFDGSGNKYAYLVTEGTGTGQGLQIVNLAGLPTSIQLVNTLTPAFAGSTYKSAHNVYVDFPSALLFIIGGIKNNGTSDSRYGILMLDILNPANPVVFDAYNEFRVHDIYVKNNLLFAGLNGAADAGTSVGPTEGRVKIFDISGSPPAFNFVTEHTYSGGIAHSMWTTADGNYMVTLAENDLRNAKFWNIQDIFNIPATPEDVFRKGNATTHDGLFKGNFLYISHFSAGLVMLDVSDKQNVIEVGHFDTYPFNNTDSLYGNWGVFPYLPSCNILLSDMQSGLHVVTLPQDVVTGSATISGSQGYAAKNSVTAAGGGTNFTVENGGESVLVAGNEIIMKDGFWAKEGSYFRARIDDPCTVVSPPYKWGGNSNNQANSSFSNTVSLEASDLIEDETETLQSETYIAILPNPNEGNFILLILSDELTNTSVYVTDMLGRIAFQKENVISSYLKIDLTSYYKGVYFVKVISGNEVFVDKIIYQ